MILQPIDFNELLFSLVRGRPLSNSEVHLLNVSIDTISSEIQSFIDVLSEDEVRRAAVYSLEKDRVQFIIGRGLLRIILGFYVDANPKELRFQYNEYGKPQLSEALLYNYISFNVSHSDNEIIYAISQGRKLGVDIERICLDLEFNEVLKRFFSPKEQWIIKNSPSEKQVNTFYMIWTRKEAYCKAIGTGIVSHFERIDVTAGTGEANRYKVSGENIEEKYWVISDISIDENYTAAVAVHGNNYRLRCWKIS